ncbi:B-cell receptor CD22-like [Alosa pseudoharengus]|uniref:B-cell receptor CD22-like n=1 Tax=Alosa pseudoharengus TaxID=34774 RepID=UPI003F8B6C33
MRSCLIVLELVVPRRVKEGDNVTLTCSTTCNLTDSTSFIWSKDGRPVEKKQIINNQLQLHPVSYEDEGSYTCAVRGQEGLPSLPENLSIMYPPKNIQIEVNPLGEIAEGSTVTLTCSSDANPPVENYTWFKVDESTPVGSGQQYSITNISSEDGGQDYCEARNKYGAENSTAVTITAGESNTTLMYIVTVLSFGSDVGEDDATQMSSLCQSLDPYIPEPDVVYQNLNPYIPETDEVYQNLNPFHNPT